MRRTLTHPTNYELSKPVQPRRIVDQDLVADRRVRRPDGELIEQPPVVDLVERANLGGLDVGA